LQLKLIQQLAPSPYCTTLQYQQAQPYNTNSNVTQATKVVPPDNRILILNRCNTAKNSEEIPGL